MSDIQSRLSAAIGESYAIERELGTGGMATVFLARDLKHDREVAIKVLLPDLSAIIGAERFEREIRVAGKLQHPHILGMFDSGVADGLLYYVMPFVKGQSLRDRIDEQGQLPIDDALQIILEVADALGYAHEQGIIHRDIKPENILLQGGHALLADFGIAHAVEDGGQKLTQTGMSLGTAAYMAPEQGMGEKIGPTADVYALGCVLFEMLAGEPPFAGKNAAAVLAKHVMEQVPSVRIVRPSVPEEVELAIFAAMGKSPADRPQSCAAWAELLVAAPSGHTSTRLMTMRHTTARRTGMMTSAFGVVPPPVPLWRRPLVLIPALLVVALGAFIGWKLTSGSGPVVPAVGGSLDPKRIAVLPFRNNEPADSILGDLASGLTENLTQALGQVTGLSVVSRGGVARYHDSIATLGVDSVAHILAAGTVVQGSVEPRGENVRVTIRLIDGNSGAPIGDPRQIDAPKGNLTAIRDSTARQVAAIIRTQLGQEIRLQEQRQGTTNNTAWLLLQQADRLRRNAATAADSQAAPLLARADSLLQAAEQADPEWAEPVIAEADMAYTASRRSGLDPLEARGSIDDGLDLINRALELDPENPDALELRGNLRYWKWLLGLEPDKTRADALIQAARKDYEQATTINPNQAGAWASLSHLYYNVDNASLLDVNTAARRAWEADAFLGNAETVLARLFLSSYDLEQWTDAGHWCDEMRRRFPGSYQAPRCALFLLTTRAESPDVARAWRLADSIADMAPSSRHEFQRLNSDLLVAAVIARASGEPGAAAGLSDSARRVVGRSRGNPTIDASADLAQFAAFVHVTLGDTTAALDDLKAFLAASDRRRVSLAQNPGWWYRPIADTPDFKRLVGTGP